MDLRLEADLEGVPLAKETSEVNKALVFLLGCSVLQHGETDRAFALGQALILLALRICYRLRVPTQPAVKSFYLVLRQTKLAKHLRALEAHIPFRIYVLSAAATLVVYIRSFGGCEDVAHVFLNEWGLIWRRKTLGVEFTWDRFHLHSQ